MVEVILMPIIGAGSARPSSTGSPSAKNADTRFAKSSNTHWLLTHKATVPDLFLKLLLLVGGKYVKLREHCHPDGANVANKRVQYQVYLNNAEREQLR